MPWYLGDEPKKWNLEKGQPILMNDYKVMSESTNTIPGLGQKYKRIDKEAEEQRLHKIRQSERASFDEGIMPYGLDNPVAPIGSETQMPYNLSELGLAAVAPSLGFAVSKGAQGLINKVRKPINPSLAEESGHDIVTTLEAFKKGIDKQKRWNMNREIQRREKVIYEDKIQPFPYFPKIHREYYTNTFPEVATTTKQPWIAAFERKPVTSVDEMLDKPRMSFLINQDKAKDLPIDEIVRTGRHEQSHLENLGGDLYTKDAENIINESVKPFWETNYAQHGWNSDAYKRYVYLTEPTEVHARIQEIRDLMPSIKKGFTPSSIIEEMDIVKLLYKYPDNRSLNDLASVAKDEKTLANLMNYLPALGGASLIPKMNTQTNKSEWR